MSWVGLLLIGRLLNPDGEPDAPGMGPYEVGIVEAGPVVRLEQREPHDVLTFVRAPARREAPAWQRLWKGDQTEVLDSPRWVKHEVRPRERIHQVAARYGVTVRQLRKWNEGREFRTGRVWSVRAERIPPPREEIVHAVSSGETWGSIAAEYRVATRDLHAWNYQVRTLEAGIELDVWVDPGLPWTVYRRPGQRHSPPPIRGDARSVGRPDRGKLSNGLELPERPELYTRRDAPTLFGSSHALTHLTRAISRMRHETGFEGELFIGAISRPRGGRFPPHRSHQSGRDVDIRLPLLPGVPQRHDPNPDEVDWEATFALVRALAETGEVHVIFLETSVQRHLYEAGRVLGETHDTLRPLIQWPPEPDKGRTLVKHEKGHDGHIHVRFSCGPAEDRCKPR